MLPAVSAFSFRTIFAFHLGHCEHLKVCSSGNFRRITSTLGHNSVFGRLFLTNCQKWEPSGQRQHDHVRACPQGLYLDKILLYTSRATSWEQHKFKTGRAEKFAETKKQVKEAKQMVKDKIEGMKENIITVPNALCMARIVLTPLLGYFVITSQFGLAMSLFVFAGATDMLDGYIARKFESQRTVMGSFLDPVADKFLVATLFATLTCVHLLPVPLTALIIGRDVILVCAGFVIRYQSLPPPKTLARYFDVTMATAQLSPTMISKVNTAMQLFMVTAALGAPVFDYTAHPALEYLWYITAATTVLSGLSYIMSKGTVKFIRPKKQT